METKVKLGFVLTITGEGFKKVHSENEDKWALEIFDVRPAIKTLTEFPGTGKTVCLLKFLGSKGYLFIFIKTTIGRATDNSVAWIHVPANAEISNVEMFEVIEGVKGAIFGANRKDFYKIKEIFKKEYNVNSVKSPAVSSIVSQEEGQYAVGYYSAEDYTLKELLGNKIAQEEYGKYKGIFFIDKNDGIGFDKTKCKEIKLDPKDIVNIAIDEQDGFKPYVDGKPCGGEFEKPAGSELKITYKKDKYKDIDKSVTIDTNRNWKEIIKILPEEKYVKVSKRDFHVVGPSEFNLAIDGEKITNIYYISESQFKRGVKFRVWANEYDDFEGTISEKMPNHNINMKKTEFYYKFKIGKNIEFKLEGTETLKKSPLFGYRTKSKQRPQKNGETKLVYDIRLILLSFVAGFITCALAVGIWAGINSLNNKNSQPTPTLQQETNNYATDNTDTTQLIKEDNKSTIDSAIVYLDSAKIWHKDSLEKFEKTKGLFDELNEFKIYHIKQRVDGDLKDSEKLKQVLDNLQNGQEKGIDFEEGRKTNNGKYNSPTDKGIDIENYIKYVTTKPEPKSEIVPKKSGLGSSKTEKDTNKRKNREEENKNKRNENNS